ncbi:MAG: DUF167 family protein, partial [Elusimicrobiota bacterium]|nr:DUF167 family protein [Elusimicrobiota bacterium]
MFIKLKVHPDSRRDKVFRKAPDAYEIWTKSPAERGLANASAIRQLSVEIGVDAKRILLVKGAAS